MDTVRTLACKLAPTDEQRAALDATLVAFAGACNFIADVARQMHSSNKVKVQHACYTDVRSRFGLSANLAIRAIARVCAALKVKSKAHSTFAPTSIDYDQRICSFREWDWTFSLTLLRSRERLETALGDYQKGRLKGQTPTSATLVKRRDGTFFLHIQLKRSAPASYTPTGTLGVDPGVRQGGVWRWIPMPSPTKPRRYNASVRTTRKSGARCNAKPWRTPGQTAFETALWQGTAPHASD